MTAPYQPGPYPGAPVYPPAGYPAPMPAGQFYGQPAAGPAGAPLPPGVVPQPHWGAPPAAPPAGPVAPYGAPAAPPAQPAGDFMSQRFPNHQNVPEELRGRSFGEAMRYYGIMRQDFLARREQERMAAAGPPLQGQPAGGQPAGQPGHAAPGAPAAPDPIQARVDAAVAAATSRMAGPIYQNATEMAYDRVSRAFPDWQHYDAEVKGYLQGFSAEQLANPQTWELAYDLVRGRRLRAAAQPNGGYPQPTYPAPAPAGGAPPFPALPPGPPAGYPAAGGYGGGYGYPPAPTGQGGPPAPPSPYFVEAPTPTAPVGGAPADPRDEGFAARFGVPVEEYRAWKAASGQRDPRVAADLASRRMAQNGQPGAPPVGAAPGYGAPPMMPPNYGYPPPGYPPAPPQPQYYGPPSAYAGMATPNGGYFGR